MRPLTTPPTASTANTAAIMSARGIARLLSAATQTSVATATKSSSYAMRATADELPDMRCMRCVLPPTSYPFVEHPKRATGSTRNPPDADREDEELKGRMHGLGAPAPYR